MILKTQKIYKLFGDSNFYGGNGVTWLALQTVDL